MAGIAWQGGSGDWNTGSLWNGGVVPNGTTAEAVIATVGSYTVTISNNESFTVDAVTLDNPTATLDIAFGGSLTLAGTDALLALDAGTLDFTGGTLAGGTIDLAGGAIEGFGTLVGVTLEGALDLSAGDLTFANGFFLQSGTSGVPGTVLVTGGESGLSFEGNATLADDDVTFGQTGVDSFEVLNIGGGSLVIGASSTLAFTGSLASVDIGAEDDGQVVESALVNQGLITLAGTHEDVTARIGGFTNTGTVNIGAGDELEIVISANSGAPQGSFSNTGIITIGLSAELFLGALSGTSLNATELGTIQNNGGELVLNGSYDNIGQTITLGITGAFSNLALQQGTIDGGTIDAAGGKISFSQADLNDVTWETGSLDVSGILSITDGLTFPGGAGTLTVEGELFFTDSETLTGDDIIVNGGHFGLSGGGSLTLGAGTTLTTTGTSTITGLIDNASLIDVQSGAAIIALTTAASLGTVDVAAGATLVAGGAFTLADLGTFNNAGTLDIAGTLENAGQTLDIVAGGSLADVVLNGTIAGGVVRTDGGTLATPYLSVFSGVTYQGTLVLSPNAELTIENGATFSGANGTGAGTILFTNPLQSLIFSGAETINNVAVIFDSASNNSGEADITISNTLVVGPQAIIEDGGTVAAADGQIYGGTLVNQGTIAVFGSLADLTIASNVVNTGTLVIGSDATLSLGFNGALANLGSVVNEGGLLEFTGSINNAGATIDVLAGSNFSDVAFTSGEISGGVIRLDGGSMDLLRIGYSAAETLAGVTVEGTLALDAANEGFASSGFTLLGSSGVGPGELDLTGTAGSLEIISSFTLDDATLDIGSAGGDTLSVDYTETLTLGPSLVIDNVGTGGLTFLGGAGTIINHGTIVAGSSGGVLEIAPADGFGPSAVGTFINLGVIDLEAGATLETSFAELGQLGSVTFAGGVLELAGSLANGGDTLTIGTGGSLADVELAGSVAGGTIVVAAGGTLSFAGGTLSGVAVAGPLDLATAGATLTVLGGSTLSGTEGGPGTIDLTGPAARLLVGDSETFADMLVDIGNTVSADLLLAGETLTLAANVTVDDTQADALAALDVTSSGTLINAGTILDDAVGGTLTLGQLYSGSFGEPTPTTKAFFNTGTIEIGSGATLDIFASTSIAALGTILNDGGAIELSGTFNNAGTVLVAAGSEYADLILNGTLLGGTLQVAGGSLALETAVLSGVSFIGSALELGHETLTIESGSSLLGSGGPLTLDFDAAGYLGLGAGETVSDTVITLTGTGVDAALQVLGGVATLDALTTISALGSGDLVMLENSAPYQGFGAMASAADIDVGNAATLQIAMSAFTNTGTIALGTGATLEIGILNTGLFVGAYETVALSALGTVTGNQDVLDVEADLVLGSQTINLGSGLFNTLLVRGTLTGGTIATAGGTLSVATGASLIGTTIEGEVTEAAAAGYFTVADGLTLLGAGGTGPGTLDVSGTGSEVLISGTTTLDNAVVIVSGSAGAFSNNVQFPGLAATGILTLGPHMLVENLTAGTGGGIGGPGTIINQGTIAAGSGATVYVTPYGAYQDQPLFVNTGTLVIAAGGTLVLDAYLTTATFGTIADAGGVLALAGQVDNTGETIDVTAAGSLENLMLGALAEGGTTDTVLSLDDGTVLSDGGTISFLGYDFLFGVDYLGPMTVGAGGTVLLQDETTVQALGGGAETITLAGGELEVINATLTDVLIQFAGSGSVLELPEPGSFTSALSDFVAGDTLELEVATGSITTLTYDGSDLVAFDGGTALGTFDIGGGYTLADFAFGIEAGDTLYDYITTSQEVPCYLAGTRIATADGEVPVESLQGGDLVRTASGAVRPVRWIGRRSYAARFVAGNPDVLPILIRAGAIADAVPRRHLWVSPKHAMYVDGVLIAAELLVNGKTIVRDCGVGDIHYFHVELDAHDILLAEGAAAESFIDCDSRMMFQNAPEFFVFHPQVTAAADCAKRVEDGEILAEVRRRLAARGGLSADHVTDAATPGPLDGRIDVLDHMMVSGWIFDATKPHTAVRVEVLVDGEVVAGCLANRFRADLRHAGKGQGRCAFVCRLPAALSDDADHVVQVRRAGDQASLPAVYLAATPARPGPLEGRVDVCNEIGIEGWVLDTDWPDVPVRLEVVDGARVIGRTLANRHRPDLAVAGKAGGNCAFVFQFESTAVPRDPGRVFVRRAGEKTKSRKKFFGSFFQKRTA